VPIEFRSFFEERRLTGHPLRASRVVPRGLDGGGAMGRRWKLWSLWNRRQSHKFNGGELHRAAGALSCVFLEGQPGEGTWSTSIWRNAAILRQ